MAIRNPVEWGADQFRQTMFGIESVNRGIVPSASVGHMAQPIVRRIKVADLKDVLAGGFRDFGAQRTDVVFLCAFYPVIGLLFASMAAGHAMLPLLFPLVSGFALLGPIAGVGLNEMSRRRELGISEGWTDVFRVLHSPSIGAIVLLGAVLSGLFLAWLMTAYALYDLTLGPQAPASFAAFAHDVFQTAAGHRLIVTGVAAGFIFASIVLVISVVAFPLLLDREVGVEVAVRTSLRAVRANPVPMAVWGLIIAASLMIGSIPLLLGLVIALPVLGHASWHLYRKMVIMP